MTTETAHYKLCLQRKQRRDTHRYSTNRPLNQTCTVSFALIANLFKCVQSIVSTYCQQRREKFLTSRVFTVSIQFKLKPIQRFHSRDQHLCKSIGTKKSVCIRKEFNSHRIGFWTPTGPTFHGFGTPIWPPCVMWKHSIENYFIFTFWYAITLAVCRW